GKLDRKFSFSSTDCVASANLVVFAGFQEVNEAEVVCGRRRLVEFELRIIDGAAERDNVFVLADPSAIADEARHQPSLPAEPCKGVVAREILITSCLQPQLSWDRKVTQLTHEPGQFSEQEFVGESALKTVRL